MYTSFLQPETSFDNLHHKKLHEFWIIVTYFLNLVLNKRVIPPDCRPVEFDLFNKDVKLLYPEFQYGNDSKFPRELQNHNYLCYPKNHYYVIYLPIPY